METKKKHELSLAKRMAISLVCGLVAGLAFMFLREHLNASGQAQTWTTINNLLFQDITAEGAERAFGIFYIIGQLFIKALQLVIIPMVFTSISLAIGSIADIRTMGRISAKTLFWFLLCSFLALLLAGCVGYGTYSMGLFNTRIEGLAEASGSTGSNPLNVVLNIIPSNIITAFGSNGAVLSSVFLAVAIGLSMNTLGESRTATLRRLLGEVNDVVVVFLNFIVSNFAPFAVFVLLTRTFAIYGIDYLKPAQENPQLVKALGGLGGGIGYCGDTCGCLTGGACAIGLFLGNLAPQEKEDIQMKPAVQELYQWFHKKTEEEFGAFYCKDITSNLDWGIVMEQCPALIADTYTKVIEILTERGILEL